MIAVEGRTGQDLLGRTRALIDQLAVLCGAQQWNNARVLAVTVKMNLEKLWSSRQYPPRLLIELSDEVGQVTVV